MSHRGPERPKLKFAGVVVVLLVIAAVVLAWSLVSGNKDAPEAHPSQPPIRIPGETEIQLAAPPTESPAEEAPVIEGPIDPQHPGFTTLRGNWGRNFQGVGPVPLHPKVFWRAGPWCGTSNDQGATSTWCGTGWNGTPNVIPQKDGSVEIRVGGYDYSYHFLDGATGRPTRPPFRTGDLAKGSATSDPNGYPLYYVGSRDNQFRILALDRGRPVELWSMDANTSVPNPQWNDDWDGAAQIVGDYMLEGGENSWFYVVRLNRGYKGNKVTVDPKIVFTAPGWDQQMLNDDRSVGQSSADISIEDSVAYDPKRKVAYFGNSGGLMQGWDISKILDGGTQADRVFRYWTAGENDASIVIGEDGDLYVSEHYQPPNRRAQEIGQLVKLDPTKKGNPLIWKVKENRTYDGEAGFFSTPALVGDTIFASAHAGDLMAIDAETGRVYWRYHMTPPLWSGPVVVDDELVIGDCSGRLYAFDVSDPKKKPKKLWDMMLGGCIESTPAVWDGMIYVGTRAGYEYGIGDKHPANLERQWEAGQATPLQPTPASRSSQSAGPTSSPSRTPGA